MKISDYYHWLKKDWAKAGFILAIYLFFFLYILLYRSDFVLFLLLVQTPLYLLHETEEYIFPGGFGPFFNMDVMKLKTADKPIDENFIFIINIVLVWIMLPTFGLLATRNYEFGLWIPYFTFFAGVAHIALALRARKKYNPGMIVSLVLNIPVGLWTVLYLIREQLLPNLFLNIHFFIGLGVNLLLPVIGVALYKTHKKSIASQ